MNKEDKFEYLGGIRGAAAFTVFLAHVIQIYWLRLLGLGSWLHTVSSEASYYSVVVFFVLSGFLITHSIETNVARHGVLNLSEFLAARLARLYPPFLFAIVISLLVYGCLELFSLPGRSMPMTLPGDVYAARKIVNLPPAELLTALLMRDGLLQINGPLWSLYMEAKLYILFACAYVLWQWRRPYFLLGVLAIVLYYTLRAGWRYNPEFMRYAAIWLIGCCAYYLCMPARQSAQRRSLACSASLVALVVAVDLIAPYLGVSPLRGGGRPIWIDSVISAGIGWLLFGLRLRLSFGGRMADYSYSLYATHFPLLLLFQSLLVAVGNTSIIGAAFASACGGAAAIAIARIGRRFEVAKPMFQQQLLSLWQVVFKRSVALLPNRPR